MKLLQSDKLYPTVLLGLYLTLSPVAARADLFSCSSDAMSTMVDAMLTLSTDIGTMADRIVETEDKIGEMADRIVQTEELMADTLVQLNQNISAMDGGTGVLLLSPQTGAVLSRTTAPEINLSNAASSYVLYLSATADFSGNQVIPLLVTTTTSLQDIWAQASESINAANIYLAVRSIDEQYRLSPLSNIVRITW